MATEYGGSDSEITTGTVDALHRQPTVFDYSQSNQFKVYFPIFPTTEWFVVRANIPSVVLGVADQYTPFVQVAMVGDHITYGDFNVTFIVDENLKNYMEMYNWVKNIGFPFSHDQFNKLERPDYQDRSGGTNYNPETDTYSKANDRDLYTDIILQIMTAKNNLIATCEIYEAFPTTLGAIEYSQQETDMTYATCEVGFAYTWFDVKPVSSTA